AAIGALEENELPKRPSAADCEGLMPKVEALVTAREDYMPGSAQYRDGVFHWQTDDGTNCGYDPAMRAAIINAVPMPKAERIAAEREAGRAAELAAAGDTAVLMSGNPDARDVAVFIPWWGKDVNFRLSLYYTGVKLADATGGECRLYLGEDAAVDAIADALTTCCVVMINTHGSIGSISVCTDEGITAEDSAWSLGEGSWAVTGECIRDHLRAPVTAGFVSLNACSCMGSESLSEQLREAGVDLVFGYTQSVHFGISERFTECFADGLVQGMTAAKASVYSKQQVCRWVLDEHKIKNEAVIAMLEAAGTVDWDLWQGNGIVTAAQAKEAEAAFPLYVSLQDPYPGVEHKDEIQTVKSTWKLPLDKSTQTNIRALGTVGHYFAAAFPDAVEKITLLSGALPPGIEIGTKDYVFNSDDYYVKKTIVNTPCLYGIPTSPGYYDAQLKVELEDGTVENRRAQVVIAEEIMTSHNEFKAEPGVEQTILLYKDTIVQAVQLSGRVPPGMTFLSDGGKPRYSGTPMEAGTFTATYRLALTSGKVVDHTVDVIVPARYGVSSENLSLFVDAERTAFLNFEGVEQVRSMYLSSGELPPGMKFEYSMSEAPHYSGTPKTEGIYRAVFRVVLLNGKTVTHMVTATVRREAPFQNVYPMDLSLGETCIPKADVDSWLFNTFYSAALAGQIRMSPDADRRFDLDKDGTWDIRTVTKADGSVVFSLMDSSSLTEDDYTLTLNGAAVAEANSRWEADHSKKYVKSISFHLNTPFELYVAGIRVGTRNREDILGNGVFSFDGADTLFIHGDYTAGGAEPMIRNGIDGLTVSTDEECALSCWGNCIETTRSLSLTGPGQLTLRSETGSGIVCDSSLLTVYNTSLMIQADKGKGITAKGDVSVFARLSRANLFLRTGEGAMDGFWSIGMYGCAVSNPLRGEVGTIGSRACLVDENKALLKTVQVTAYDTKYGLTIDGIPVTDKNRANVLKDGTFSFDGDHTLTVNKSFTGVNSQTPLIRSSIDGLVINAAPDVVLTSWNMNCVSLGGTTTLSGGPLTVVSESRFGQGIGLEADAGLLVSDMTLSASGGRFGIRGSEGSGKLVLTGNASVTAVCTGSSPVAAIRVPGGLARCTVSAPEGGSIQAGTVVDSGGNPAKEANLVFLKEYDLIINGIPVTSQNMNDLGASFSFDGDHTLTVRGDCRSEYNIIENNMDGLVIYVEKDAVLSTEPEYEWDMPIGSPVFTGADMTVTGPGKLTLRGGINPGLSAAYGAALTIKDANITSNRVTGTSGGTSLALDNAVLACDALIGFDGGIILTGCEIVSPAGGAVKDGAVVKADGTAAAEVVVAPAEISVSGSKMKYSVYIPG
ncbi:MAG: carbohydrate-binding domain-containing protein, partial [Clostridia bacterium]|nr:carbohydrate-binding domain-containing protein [Clostridia bacterium]